MSDPNPSPKVVILQGEPGMGKTVMACRTAIHKPVHVCDIDRKIRSAGWAQPLLANGNLSYWELEEPYDEENIKSRLVQLASNEKLTKMPMGISKFSEYMYKLPRTEEGKRAGTYLIDSSTILNYHAMMMISYHAGRNRFIWEDWASLMKWWMSATSNLKDMAKAEGKDLMFTVHEKQSEKAGDKTSGVSYEMGKDGNRTKIFHGRMDLKIHASISGQFGELFGAIADEYYYLYVEIVNGKPVWKCRVHPDGVRPLRTSFIHSEAVHEPDFAKIWR